LNLLTIEEEMIVEEAERFSDELFPEDLLAEEVL